MAVQAPGNFWHTCLQSHLQTSPPTPQKSYPKFRNPKTTFEIFKKNLKTPPRGPGGVSEFFGGLISPFLCENKPHVKFQNSN